VSFPYYVSDVAHAHVRRQKKFGKVRDSVKIGAPPPPYGRGALLPKWTALSVKTKFDATCKMVRSDWPRRWYRGGRPGLYRRGSECPMSGDCRTASPWFDGLHLLGTHSTHRTACNPPHWQSPPWLRALVDRVGGHRPG